MARSDGNKLISLEAGRFFAAAGVMLFHYTGVIANFRGVTVFGDVFRPGHVGVPYFFVLSGFIIYHVHRADLGQAGALGRFAVKRAVRLFPMFLIVSLAMLLAFLVSPSMAGQRELTPLGVTADLLLLPHADAILSISWTLRHEMVFYALFALALWLGARAFWAVGAWIAISVAVGVYAAATGVNTIPWMGSWSVTTSTLNLGFGLGMMVAANLKTPAASRAWPLIGLGGGLMLSLCVIEWVFGRGAPHDVDVLGPFGAIGLLLGAAALISGLVRLEARWSMPAPSFWKAAGGSSYVLYLIHQPLASVAVRFLKHLPLSPEATFVILAVSAVAAALVIHLTVETWLLKRLSALGRRGEPQTVTNDTAPTPAPASTTGFALTTPQPPGQSQG